MPDISMCRDHMCPLRHKCHRYTAVPSYWQAYASFKADKDKCDYFWDNKGLPKR